MESVRAARPDDLATIVPLVDAFVDEQRSQRGGAIWAARSAPTLTPEALARAIDDPGQFVSLGCIDDHVAGVCVGAFEQLDETRRIAVVRCLYVQPGCREVGVGSALLDDVIERATEAGCVGVDATVLPGDRRAKNFFEMHGLVARAIDVHRPVGEGS